MPDRSRIPKNAASFTAYMVRWDNLQMLPGKIPGKQKWNDWMFTLAERKKITFFRKRAEKLYKFVAIGKLCPPTKKTQMRILINTVKDYDHGNVNGHHLLAKIGISGTISDYESLNIKAGTALALSTHTSHVENPGLQPVVSLRKLGYCYHELSVVNPETPTKKAVPFGIFYAKVFCYVGTEPPNSPGDYTEKGNAKYGIFKSTFNVDDFDPKLKYYAWYYACYYSKKGNACTASAVLQVPIVV